MKKKRGCVYMYVLMFIMSRVAAKFFRFNFGDIFLSVFLPANSSIWSIRTSNKSSSWICTNSLKNIYCNIRVQSNYANTNTPPTQIVYPKFWIMNEADMAFHTVGIHCGKSVELLHSKSTPYSSYSTEIWGGRFSPVDSWNNHLTITGCGSCI